MKQVILSTGNKVKLQEAIAACKPFGIDVINKNLDIDEIQSVDSMKISIHKAKTAYSILLKPVVINDSFWEIPALNGFPGGYMKDIIEWFTGDDFINLMKNKTDRRVSVTECVVYQDSAITKTFTNKYWGEIALQPFGAGNSFEQVVVFNGVTLGEYHRTRKLVYDPKDYIWNNFAEWFSSYNN